MGKSLTFEEIVTFVVENSKCQLLSIDYHNNREKLNFRCNCGNEFDVSFNKFRDQNQRQCKECGKELNNKNKRHDIEYIRNFVKQNSNCILLSSEYKNNRTKLKMLCWCGNEFDVSFDNFTQGTRNCKDCTQNKRTESQKLNIDDIRTFINENTKCKLLSDEYISAHDKLTFQCECGNEFSRNWNNFKNGQIYCRECIKGYSKGETKVKKYLEKNKLLFIQEFTFDKCKHRRKLPFDFYLPTEHICIEYDGEFHFDLDKMVNFHNASLQQKRDAIKTKFCEDNDIKLIRIPYWEYENIENILDKYISNNKMAAL